MNQSFYVRISCLLGLIALFAQGFSQNTFSFGTPALQKFSNALDHITNDRPESLPLAVQKYQECMQGQDGSTADSAYVLLEDFALQSTDVIDFNLLLLRAGNEERNTEEKKAAEEYEIFLKKNHFAVTRENDFISITPDMPSIQEMLKNYLSPRSYSYFEAVNKENKEDNGLIDGHSPEKIAERLCFWERFLADSAPFLYRQEAEQRRNLYLESLVFGSERQPIFRKDGKLDPAYQKAYRHIVAAPEEKLPLQSKTRKTVSEYLQLLQACEYKDDPRIWVFSF